LASVLDKDELQAAIDEVAARMRVDVDAVPPGDFIPIPPDAADRHRHIGRFGSIEAFVFDPYSIALSKIDRGFDADIDDVAFLLHSAIVVPDKLDHLVGQALAHAHEYDLSRDRMYKHLEAAFRRAGVGTAGGSD
jgi:hypothetical protein